MPTAVDTFDRPLCGAESVASTWIVRLLPSLTDLSFLLPLFVLFGILPGSKLLLADADVGWHLRTGEWILAHHAVPTHDLFSYTRPEAPWFAWEWAWDVCFAAVHRLGGLSGVVAVNVAVLGLVAVLTFRLVRRTCGNDLIAFALTGVAMCGSTLHWLARPHLISWLFFLAFAHLISKANEGRSHFLWLLPVLMVLWTNIHGSFFLGIAMAAIAAVAPWLDWAIHGGNPEHSWSASRPFLLPLTACFAATFLNPYGWHLHEHIVRYLADSKQMDVMQEFQSMNFHHAPAPFFELALLLGLASLFWCVRERRWDGFLTVLLFAHLGLFAVRNVPMYLFLSAPWIGCMLQSALSSQSRAARFFAKPFRTFADEFQPLERVERIYILACAGFAFVVLSIFAGQGNFTARFDSKNFPESSLRVIDRYKPARIFARDQWSAYLIYQRFPNMKVFIDDRSDFYGADMLDRTRHILNARWDWEPNLLRFSTDMVIVATDTPITTVLKSSPRWQLVLDDGNVVVFIRRGSPAATPTVAAVSARRSSAVARNGGSTLGA